MTPPDAIESSDYYQSRRFDVPAGELWPESTDELKEAVLDLSAGDRPWQILGDGQHARRLSESAGDSVVIRTEGVDRILGLDIESGLVRVESGIRWKALQEGLADEGFSLQRYGLHPATSTVGGMLARRRPGPPRLRGGAILDGCISVGAFSTDDGDYRYLAAPRKASGPDLRYEFIGNGGDAGAILDATLVVWRPVSERVLRFEDCTLQDAAGLMGQLFSADIEHSGVHYSHKGQVLQVFIAAPGQLLRGRIRFICDRIKAPDEIGDTEAAHTRRRWLEARHPDRRSHPDADRTRVFWLAPSALTEKPAQLFGTGVSNVEITTWTPRRVEAFVRYGQNLADLSLSAAPDEACWADWPLIPMQ